MAIATGCKAGGFFIVPCPAGRTPGTFVW